MAFRKFEELPVWQAAMDLAVKVFDLSSRGTFRAHSGLRDQIERAVISISNNIAEGYERGTFEELITFLYYARGSAGEVRSMLDFLNRSTEWDSLRAELESLLTLCHNISRQLGAWIESVKNSEHGGHRYQNDATRQSRDAARRQASFPDVLRRVQEQARPSDTPNGPPE